MCVCISGIVMHVKERQNFSFCSLCPKHTHPSSPVSPLQEEVTERQWEILHKEAQICKMKSHSTSHFCIISKILNQMYPPFPFPCFVQVYHPQWPHFPLQDVNKGDALISFFCEVVAVSVLYSASKDSFVVMLLLRLGLNGPKIWQKPHCFLASAVVHDNNFKRANHMLCQ